MDELIALECEFFEMDVSHGGPPPWEHREVRAEEIRMPAKPGVLQFSYHPSGIGMCEPPGSSTSGTWHFFSIDLARAWEIAESAVKDAEKRDPEFFAGIRRIAGWMVRG